MKKKIALLNPPGSKPFLREYYCSKTPKAPFTYHPVDLCYISGRLASDYELFVVDCIAERIRPEECVNIFEKARPHAIISMTGHVSWREDLSLFKRIKEATDIGIIATGDTLLDSADKKIHEGSLEAAILDFTNDDIVHYLNKDFEKIRQMCYLADGQTFVNVAPRERGVEFEMPVPYLSVFPTDKYDYPFIRRKPFGAVMTDYGCPNNCEFCAMSRLGWKLRKIENVIQELDMLRDSGAKEVLFMDQTFGASWERTEKLLDAINRRDYGFGFLCWTRPDLLTAEKAMTLKKSGFHTVMMGAETCSDSLLLKYSKDFSVNDIERGFRTAKEAGLRTVATMLLGLPGEAEDDMKLSSQFAIKLDPDFASFNVAVPRCGTALRERMTLDGECTFDCIVLDQSGGFQGDINSDVAFYMRQAAEKAFYFRFSYILKRISKARTIHEIRWLIIAGLSILNCARG